MQGGMIILIVKKVNNGVLLGAKIQREAIREIPAILILEFRRAFMANLEE
jgi:hypothetical protein